MKHVILLMFILFVAAATNLSLGASSNGEEIFPGQRDLSILLRAVGGFEGKIFLQDKPRPGIGHEERMLDTLTQSIQNKHILTYEGVEGTVHEIEKRRDGWISGYYAEEVKKHNVRVIHVPTLWHHGARLPDREGVLQILKDQDILAVYAAGNFGTVPLDLYYPENPYWGNAPPWDRNAGKLVEYQEVESFFKGGHAVMATFAIRKPETLRDFTHWALGERNEKDVQEMYQIAEGEYIRHPLTARFGDLKEYGFSVFLEKKGFSWDRDKGEGKYVPGTSRASAHVAAFAFYLYQLWDTTAEVLEVMQKTAIDIGEPGVDEEFGWGLINADHPIIWDKAAKKLEKSLELCLLEDVALEQGMMTAEKEGFDLFHSVESDKREIGFIFGRNKAKVAFATGSTARPFGISSRFLQQQSTTTQIGIRHSVSDNISVTGIYGHSSHENFGVNKGSIGLGYQKYFSDNSGNLSLYVGHRFVWGSVGIPGYRAFDIAQTPFALQMVEMRASFACFFN